MKQLEFSVQSKCIKGDFSLSFFYSFSLSKKKTLELIAEECSILLVAMNWFFRDDREEATKILSQLHETWPGSPVLCFLSGWLESLREDFSEAISFYNKAYECTDVPQLRASAKYHLGYSYFLLCEWEKSKNLLTEYINGNYATIFVVQVFIYYNFVKIR